MRLLVLPVPRLGQTAQITVDRDGEALTFPVALNPEAPALQTNLTEQQRALQTALGEQQRQLQGALVQQAQAARDGEIHLYMDIKPEYPDTPPKWETRLEIVFYQAERKRE